VSERVTTIYRVIVPTPARAACEMMRVRTDRPLVAAAATTSGLRDPCGIFQIISPIGTSVPARRFDRTHLIGGTAASNQRGEDSAAAFSSRGRARVGEAERGAYRGVSLPN